ncbi:MAG: FKBP-type peptidyl-prolyl cis-trans isomerase [Bacteroidales bacterium]|nr:FKBP-type peptidyl-prolyl cis-trans isomerase [Bacteroidales bacterium]
MKTQIKKAILMAVAALVVASCGSKSDLQGFKKTPNGLHYKFVEKNAKGEQIQEGQALVGETMIIFKNDTLSSCFGNPTRIALVNNTSAFGLLNEGFLMMHVGDYAIFAIPADTMANYFKMPPSYVKGENEKFFYHVKVSDVISPEELKEEYENFMENMKERQESEPDSIAKFIAENKITVKPNAEGLYVIVKKKGNGPRVEAGKTVQVNYTGRLLDGTMFDSSVEADAKEGGIYNSQRQYVPMSYKVGVDGLIRGWDEGVMGQPEGTKLTLVFPSALGYAERGAGELIPPFSPLTFDIEILSVK